MNLWLVGILEGVEPRLDEVGRWWRDRRQRGDKEGMRRWVDHWGAKEGDRWIMGGLGGGITGHEERF